MPNSNNEEGQHTDDTKGAMFSKDWSEQKTYFYVSILLNYYSCAFNGKTEI